MHVTELNAQGLSSARSRFCWFVISALVVSVLIGFALTASAGELRVWTSKDGRFSTIAELVRADADSVVLEKHDGKIVRVPTDLLSEEDANYLRQMKRGELPGAPGAVGGISGPPDRPKKSPSAIEREAGAANSARDAVLVYQFYLSRSDLNPEERTEAEKNLKKWEELASKQYVRLGRQWLPKNEAEATRERAEQKVEMALEYLRIRNGPLAEQMLKEASDLDPESEHADFLMGVVYGLIVDDDAKAANHFRECIERNPSCVGSLNNLAISLVFLNRPNDAVDYWRQAIEISPETPELTQNVATVLSYADSPELRISRKRVSELSDIYMDLLHKHKRPKPNVMTHLYYLPPTGVKWRGFGGEGGTRSSPREESVVVGSGTGWVIQPGVIVTNEHVVEDENGLLVLDPKNPSNRLPAYVMAVDKQRDLALVRCESLDAQPVPLSRNLPRRGSDIMVLGYPLGVEFGSNLKSTRGAMVAMPDATNEGMCLYDAITNPGNSGGPLCDEAGRVVGVVRAITGGVGGVYGAAIPISSADKFFRMHLSDLTYDDSDATPLGWPEVDARISPSTVLILKKENVPADLNWSRTR